MFPPRRRTPNVGVALLFNRVIYIYISKERRPKRYITPDDVSVKDSGRAAGGSWAWGSSPKYI